jgi:regulator of replication initiation timing
VLKVDETEIENMRQENERLKGENATLKAENDKLKGEQLKPSEPKKEKTIDDILHDIPKPKKSI